MIVAIAGDKQSGCREVRMLALISLAIDAVILGLLSTALSNSPDGLGALGLL